MALNTQSRIIYPDPIKKITIKSQPDDIIESPGEFELSKSQELLKKAILYDGITQDLIQGYNDIVQDKIPKSIRSSKIRVLTSAIKQYYKKNEIDYKKNKAIINDMSQLGNQYIRNNQKDIYLVFLNTKIE